MVSWPPSTKDPDLAVELDLGEGVGDPGEEGIVVLCAARCAGVGHEPLVLSSDSICCIKRMNWLSKEYVSIMTSSMS